MKVRDVIRMVEQDGCIMLERGVVIATTSIPARLASLQLRAMLEAK